jgi:hypothetical protein
MIIFSVVFIWLAGVISLVCIHLIATGQKLNKNMLHAFCTGVEGGLVVVLL